MSNTPEVLHTMSSQGCSGCAPRSMKAFWDVEVQATPGLGMLLRDAICRWPHVLSHAHVNIYYDAHAHAHAHTVRYGSAGLSAELAQSGVTAAGV